MLEWRAPASLLDEEVLPCLRVARDGRVLEASEGARKLLGGLPSGTVLARHLNLNEPELAALLGAKGRWTGRCGVIREDGLNVAVHVVVQAAEHDLLVLLVVDLAPLAEMHETLGTINSRLTNLSRERAKEAGRMAHALAENERQAHELQIQKEELELQAEELQANFEELEELNQRLEAANRELLERDRIKMQFYANISHELRAPLNSIMGFTEDALDGLAGPLTPELEHFLKTVLGSASHLLHVSTEMLDLAKLQSGRATLDLEPVDVGGLLADLANAMSPLLKRKGQTLAVADAAGLPAILADRPKLYQILLNLLSNAHRYTPDGGHLAVDAAARDGRLILAVRDNGVGIEADDLPQIFEEYRQVRAIPGVERQGTGLGLAIARRLVEMHGGTIAVESRPHQGSLFTVELPL